jgi:uncharacterized protein YggE
MEETKQFDLSNKVYKLVIAIIILVALFYAGSLYQSFQTLPQNYPQDISVSGQGKIYVKPDIATLSLSVVNEGDDVATVVTKNTERTNAVIAVVKKLGVNEEDIKTTQYNLAPRYEWRENGKRAFMGYTLTQSILLTIRDFTKIGDVIAKTTELGSSQNADFIGDLQFAIENPEKAQADARAKAIEQAKQKAKSLAKQSGLRLVKLVNVSEGGYYPQPMYGKGGGVMMDAVNAAPDIQAGQMEINSTITLTYRVK